MLRDLYVTNLTIFNRHSMSLEQIAKSIDISFLVFLTNFLKLDTSSLALDKIDMNNRPLLSATFP